MARQTCTIWYMFIEDGVEIDAAPQLVWDAFTDVEHWPEWTASVTSLVGLDGSSLAAGRRFAIKQPGMSKLVWKVTEIDPDRSWTWVHSSPGVRVTARHDVIARPGGRTLVRQQLDQRGALGALVGRLMAGRTKRFLRLEAQGLKALSEQRSRADGAHS
ncbi:SRPBCC family protein [Mycobacterium sp. M23085]|uniref:SRPBCC family protein n=1 Tax=Mycobacterium sp. M23085 TaxID=3378087 RepID=UPI003877CD41